MKTPDWPTRTVSRNFGKIDIRLRLIDDFDKVLDYCADNFPDNTDMIPYYADLWPSAEALTGFICTNHSNINNKTVIELGCGLGLPAIACAKLGASVTATDFHPHNRKYLLDNAAMNGVTLEYSRLDWSRPPADRQFDLIIGSDLLYEKKQLQPLTYCVTKLLRDDGIFILADPGRDYIQDFVTGLENSGFSHTLAINGNILILTFRRESKTWTVSNSGVD